MFHFCVLERKASQNHISDQGKKSFGIPDIVKEGTGILTAEWAPTVKEGAGTLTAEWALLDLKCFVFTDEKQNRIMDLLDAAATASVYTLWPFWKIY